MRSRLLPWLWASTTPEGGGWGHIQELSWGGDLRGHWGANLTLSLLRPRLLRTPGPPYMAMACEGLEGVDAGDRLYSAGLGTGSSTWDLGAGQSHSPLSQLLPAALPWAPMRGPPRCYFLPEGPGSGAQPLQSGCGL